MTISCKTFGSGKVMLVGDLVLNTTQSANKFFPKLKYIQVILLNTFFHASALIL